MKITNSNIERKKAIEITSAKALKEMTKSTHHAILSEKFLITASEETKNLLKGVGEYESRRQRVLESLAVAPIIFLLSFFIPAEANAWWTESKLFTSIVVGFVIGVCFFISALATKVNKRISIFVIPVSIIITTFYSTEEFLYIFLDTPVKRNIFLSVGTSLSFGFVVYCLELARSYLTMRFFPKRTLHKKVLKEQAKLLKEALATAQEAKSKEVERLIKDYKPEYTSILEELKGKPIEDNLVEFPEIKTPIPKPPKEMVLPIYMGVTEKGEHKTIDLARLPHLLVGGTTGGGKSNFLNYIIQSLLRQNVDLVLIDPEEFELANYAGLPNVDFIGDGEKGKEIIRALHKKMTRAKDVFLLKGVKNITEFNNLPGVERMKMKVVIIDELGFFEGDKELHNEIKEVASRGRKWGVHLILATQRPSKEVITPIIKSCIPASIAFRVSDENNSKLLRVKGADKIYERDRGRAILNDGNGQVFIQTPLAERTGGKKQPLAIPSSEGSKKGEDYISDALVFLKNNGGWANVKKIAEEIGYEGPLNVFGGELKKQNLQNRKIGNGRQYKLQSF